MLEKKIEYAEEMLIKARNPYDIKFYTKYIKQLKYEKSIEGYKGRLQVSEQRVLPPRSVSQRYG